MSSRSSSPRLPTFAIRDLAGSSNPPGLISISRRQYDSTIQSQPDSKLLYLDDDDGELITVGSSLELTQRLQEPVLKYSRGNFSEAHNPHDGKLVHVFDIKHSSGSLAQWKSHEVYSSKPLSAPQSQPSNSTNIADTHPPTMLDCPFYPTYQRPMFSPIPPEPVSPVSQPIQEKEPAVATEAVKILDGLGEHLTGLASVLQIAATTFQKAADKTRETDTSVVEDILKGVKDILTEVGSFGAAAFDELNRGAIASSSNTSTISSEDQSPNFIDESEDEQKPASELRGEAAVEAEACDPKTQLESTYNSTIFEPDVLPTDSEDVDYYLQSENASHTDDVGPTTACSRPTALNPFKSFASDEDSTSEVESVRKVSFQNEQLPVRPSNPSILDDSSDDADFTARYPPLRSIRRAQSTIESSKTIRPYIPYRPKIEVKNVSEQIVDFSKPFYPRFTLANPAVQVNPLQVKDHEKQDVNEVVQKPLPGAWPDAKNESTPALPISTESSGAFFNRMVARNKPLEQPSFNLHRANTTASSNPASRLNGPFDPGFPYDPSNASSWRRYGSFRPYRRPASPPRNLSDQVPPHSAQTEKFRDLPKLDTKRSVPEFARSARPRPTNFNCTPFTSNNPVYGGQPVGHSTYEPHRAVKHHRSVPHFQPYAPPPPSSFQSPWPAPLRYSPPRNNFSTTSFVPRPDQADPPAPKAVPAAVPFTRFPPPVPASATSIVPTLPAPYAPLLKPRDLPASSSSSTNNTVRQSPIFPISLTPRKDVRNDDFANLKSNSATSAKAPPPVTPFFPPPPTAVSTVSTNASNLPQPRSSLPISSAWSFEPASITEEYSDALSSTSVEVDNQKSKYEICVEKLKMCGFGIDDENLKDRLHVYAVAADGDVEEAVEMIEEDRRCTAGMNRGRE